jgi:hypothetical protein
MTSTGHNENSQPSRNASANADSKVNVGHERAFSWTRTLKILAFVLAILWVVMLHISTANSGGFIPAHFWNKIGLIITTIAAAVPILLFMRGRLLFLAGLPFLFLIALTLWVLLASLWMTHPAMRLPN